MTGHKNVVYDNTTGEIYEYTDSSGPYFELPASFETEGRTRVETFSTTLNPNPGSHYYLPNTDDIIERPTMELIVSGSVITGIPLGASVVIQAPELININTYIINDGEIDLSGSSAGVYELTIVMFPYVENNLEVII